MTDEHRREPYLCPDPGIGAGIQKLVDGQAVQTTVLAELTARVGQQNHRVEKLEHAALEARVRAEERAASLLRAQELLATHQDKQQAALKWLFMAGLAGAGLLSSIVDKVLR